jgi:hypothetical protein
MIPSKVSVWSVVVLIVSIMFFASGLVFGIIKENTARTLTVMELQIKSNAARIAILERQADVLVNELGHMNSKLTDILIELKDLKRE